MDVPLPDAGPCGSLFFISASLQCSAALSLIDLADSPTYRLACSLLSSSPSLSDVFLVPGGLHGTHSLSTGRGRPRGAAQRGAVERRGLPRLVLPEAPLDVRARVQQELDAAQVAHGRGPAERRDALLELCRAFGQLLVALVAELVLGALDVGEARADGAVAGRQGQDVAVAEVRAHRAHVREPLAAEGLGELDGVQLCSYASICIGYN